MDQKNIVIVFSGFNQRAVISFLRVLKEYNVPFAVVARSADDPIYLTSFKPHITSVRSQVSLDLNDIRMQIESAMKSMQASSCLIAPSAEALNRFLLEHLDEFESIGCTIPLVKQELYNRISDKYSFGDMCAAMGISVPREIKSSMELTPPFVAKPKTYFTADKKVFTPVLVRNDDELTQFRRDYDQEAFYFQEYVSGESYYLLYYFDRNGAVRKASQQNLVQQPGGKSMIACMASGYHLAEESARYELLFRKSGFRGLVMVEVKKQGPVHYMIEANPRFWGPSQLFLDAGNDLFAAFLEDYGLIKEKKESIQWKVNTRYFWLGGLLETMHGKQLPDFHGYSFDKLTTDLPAWMDADVYRRNDTGELFYSEFS